MKPSKLDYVSAVVWVIGLAWCAAYHPFWAVVLVAVMVGSYLWGRYGHLVSYSFRRWKRDTEGRMEAEQTKGKAELVDLLARYKEVRKRPN